MFQIMFGSWGGWCRVMLTITLFIVMVVMSPVLLDLVVTKAVHIYHQFKPETPNVPIAPKH